MLASTLFELLLDEIIFLYFSYMPQYFGSPSASGESAC